MVRNYVKKTERAQISEDVLANALNDYRNGNFRSIREAALAYGLKKSTLFYRLKKIEEKEKLNIENHDDQEDINENETQNHSGPNNEVERQIHVIHSEDMASLYSNKYSRKQVFTTEQETMIVEYIIERSLMNYGLTYAQTRQLAYNYAVALNLNKRIPPNWHKNNSAGEEWLYHFMKRHPNLSLRQAENTSLSRNTSFNEHNVAQFYDNFEKLLNKVNVPPSRIFNLDESGISTVLEAPKVIAQKGTKQVGQIVSAERGELVTFCPIVCADGSSLPPVFIFPRKRPNPAYLIGAPLGSKDLYSDSGWMTGELFLETLKHLQKCTNSSKSDPIILILDNRESHVGLNVVMYCRDNGIHLLTFHPHTTHRMQPLDICIFVPFKKYLRTEFNLWLAANPGCTITIREIAGLSKNPFNYSFTQSNILSGFRKAGIHPFDRSIFTENDFKGSNVTNRPAPPLPQEDCRPTENQCSLHNVDIPGSSSSVLLPSNTPQNEVGIPEGLTSAVYPREGVSRLETPQTPTLLNKNNCAKPQAISPKDVMPYPKYQPKVKKSGGRKKGRSMIPTDTPEKIRLENELEVKETKRLLAEKKRQARIEKQVIIKKRKGECHSRKILFEDKHENLSSGSSELDEPEYAEGGISPEEFSEFEEFPPLSDRSFNVNDFIMTKFESKKNVYNFLAQIERKVFDGFLVKYLKKKENGYRFYFPEKVETSEIELKDIIFKMP